MNITICSSTVSFLSFSIIHVLPRGDLWLTIERSPPTPNIQCPRRWIWKRFTTSLILVHTLAINFDNRYMKVIRSVLYSLKTHLQHLIVWILKNMSFYICKSATCKMFFFPAYFNSTSPIRGLLYRAQYDCLYSSSNTAYLCQPLYWPLHG